MITISVTQKQGLEPMTTAGFLRGARVESKKIPDAIIADSAHALADILVSEDRRCRQRLQCISTRCSGMDYEEFREWLRASVGTTP